MGQEGNSKKGHFFTTRWDASLVNMGWADPKKRGGKRARNKQRLESSVTRGAVALLGERD